MLFYKNCHFLRETLWWLEYLVKLDSYIKSRSCLVPQTTIKTTESLASSNAKWQQCRLCQQWKLNNNHNLTYAWVIRSTAGLSDTCHTDRHVECVTHGLASKSGLCVVHRTTHYHIIVTFLFDNSWAEWRRALRKSWPAATRTATPASRTTQLRRGCVTFTPPPLQYFIIITFISLVLCYKHQVPK